MILSCGQTDVGKRRKINEDALFARNGLFMVCDGMGGCPAGEVASRMAVEAILEELDEPSASRVREDGGYRFQTSRLAGAVRRSNQVIYKRAQQDPRQAGMGTTIVGAWISDHIASVAHVGDSRAYLWRRNCLEPLTRDHSLVEAQVRAANGRVGFQHAYGTSSLRERDPCGQAIRPRPNNNCVMLNRHIENGTKTRLVQRLDRDYA